MLCADSLWTVSDSVRVSRRSIAIISYCKPPLMLFCPCFWRVFARDDSSRRALTYCGVCVCACVDWRPVAAIPGCKSSLTLLSLPVLLTCVCACDESSHYALTHCGVCMCVSAGDSLPSFQTLIFLSCPSAGAFDLYLAPFACDDSSCRALTRCGSCVRLSADAPLS